MDRDSLVIEFLNKKCDKEFYIISGTRHFTCVSREDDTSFKILTDFFAGQMHKESLEIRLEKTFKNFIFVSGKDYVIDGFGIIEEYQP